MVDASAGVEDLSAFHKLFYLFKTRGGGGGWKGIWGATGVGFYLYFPWELGLGGLPHPSAAADLPPTPTSTQCGRRWIFGVLSPSSSPFPPPSAT